MGVNLPAKSDWAYETDQKPIQNRRMAATHTYQIFDNPLYSFTFNNNSNQRYAEDKIR